MEELIQQMKVTLANTFAFYLKAHNFHWNVEGPEFPQYHSFFETIYSDAWEAVDAIAEHIRTLDAYAPASFARFTELSEVKDELNVPTAKEMLSSLAEDNMTVIESLKSAMKLADAQGAVGISNFYQDRIDTHFKHQWMIKATGK